MLFMFFNYANISINDRLLYGLIIFTGIYAYTSIMDRMKFAWAIEFFFSCLGLFVLYKTGDWFGLEEYNELGNYIIATYFISSILGALYVLLENNQYQNSTIQKT